MTRGIKYQCVGWSVKNKKNLLYKNKKVDYTKTIKKRPFLIKKCGLFSVKTMKYVIRKVPERNTKYLERLLPEAVVVNDVNHNGAIWSFLKAIEIADDDAVYIQDDMLLCKDFKNKAEQYIKKYPNEVIVFSNHVIKNAKKYGGDVYSKEGFYPSSKGIVIMLCVYIPKQIAKDFRSFYLKGGAETLSSWEKYKKMDADDLLFCRWYQKDVLMTVPQLAGHSENKSVIVPSRPIRISPLFDYENAERKQADEN